MVDKNIVEKLLKEAQNELAVLSGCSFLELEDEKESLRAAISGLESPLQVMVMGAFSTGKSSFVNALLGENVTAVEALPTTAVITKLVYGNDEDVKVYFQDNTTSSYSSDEFKHVINENDSSWNSIRERIDYVEIALPAEVLKYINIIDSPGLEAKDIHTKITKRFVNNSDVVFWMFSAENVGTDTEFKAISDLESRLLPIAIINKMDTLDEEEDDPEEFIKDIKIKLGDKVCSVIGISAKLALEGQATGDQKIIQESNISDVKQFINENIIPNRDEYKLNSYMEDMAVWLTTVMVKIKKYINYHKTTSASSEYATAKKRAHEFKKNVYNNINLLKDYSQKLATTGNTSACVFLSNVMLGCDEELSEYNFNKALEYLEKAAENNNLLAQCILACIYIDSGNDEKAGHWATIVNARFVEEVDLYDMKGDILFVLGYVASNKGDYKKAYNLYERAIENGSSAAANNLGFAYQHGVGIEVDYEKALKCYNFAAEDDIPVAQYNLGFMYYYGHGTAENKEMALKWIRLGAENGHKIAQYSLATFYFSGDCGLDKDLKEGIKWLKLAEEQNDLDAKILLVTVYAGLVDESLSDYQQGVKLGEELYKQYEDNKDISEEVMEDVLKSLIIMYDEGGHGIKRNADRFLYWCKVAAEAGYAVAQFRLGNVYIDGEDVPTDYEKARYWWEKAAAQGFEGAIQGLADLNAFLNKKSTSSNSSGTNSEGCLVWLAFPFVVMEFIYYWLA